MIGEAALFVKGLDEAERKDITYERLKGLLTHRFTETLPLQRYYTLLHEARQEKGETPAQFLDRLREISAKMIRKGSTPVECAILAEEGRYRLLSAFIHGCSQPVGRELKFRAPENPESALRIATTVDSVVRLEQNSRREQIFKLDAKPVQCCRCKRCGHMSKDCRTVVRFESRDSHPRERKRGYEEEKKTEGPNNEFRKTQVTRKDGREPAEAKC